MKVLFFVTEPGPVEGPIVCLERLLPRLAVRPALEIRIASLGAGPRLRARLDATGLRTTHLGAWRPLGGGVRLLREHLQREAFDLCVASGRLADQVARRAATDLVSVELITLEHGPQFWAEPGTRAARAARHDYLGKTLHRIRTIVCPSEWVRWELFRLGIQGERMRIIHHGVDPAVFAPATSERRAAARARLGLADGTVAFGFVGRPSADKGYDVLLEAWRGGGPGVVLALDGAAGEAERSRLQRSAPEGVRWLPAVAPDAMAAEFHAALDVLVAPSRVETFGLAAAEAMAAGLPAILAEAGGLIELARDDAALMVAPGDAAALRGAMERVARMDAAERRRRGDAARAHIARHFSLAASVANWAELLENVPRPRLQHDAHLAAIARGEEGLYTTLQAAQEIAASAQKFAEEYDKDEKAIEQQEDLAGRVK